MTDPSVHTCMSCGHVFQGRFCSQCGEKVLEPSERTVMHFALQIANELTSFESRFWSTLKTIVTHPGQLSADFSKGRRNPYMKPITLFFLGNLIYFLFPILDTFNTLLQYQYQMPYTELANIPERVERAIAASGMSEQAFQLAYNKATESNSKLLLICLVPLMAPVFVLVGLPQRRMLSEQLLFSLEYSIFTLYINTLLIGYGLLLMQMIVRVFSEANLSITDLHVTALAAMLAFGFLFLAVRRFYQYGAAVSFALALVALFGSFSAIMVYRWILFEITIRSV